MSKSQPCPACGAANPEGAKKCSSCGERFNRRPRRQDLLDESDSPFGKRNDSRHTPGLQAYRTSVYSIIPLAGLVLGPLALLLAARAWVLARRNPAAKKSRHAFFAVVLGIITTVANVAGVYLMAQALWSSGGP